MYLLPWTNYSHIHVASHYSCLQLLSSKQNRTDTGVGIPSQRAEASIYGVLADYQGNLHCVGRRQGKQRHAGSHSCGHIGIQVSYQGCEFGVVGVSLPLGVLCLHGCPEAHSSRHTRG